MVILAVVVVIALVITALWWFSPGRRVEVGGRPQRRQPLPDTQRAENTLLGRGPNGPNGGGSF